MKLTEKQQKLMEFLKRNKNQHNSLNRQEVVDHFDKHFGINCVSFGLILSNLKDKKLVRVSKSNKLIIVLEPVKEQSTKSDNSTKTTMSSKIDGFDSKSINTFKDAIEEKFKEISKQYGLKISTGTIRYQTDNAKFTVEIVVADKEESIERRNWDLSCFLYGLKPEQYKTRVMLDKGLYATAIKINNKSPKYPIEMVKNDGKMVKCSVSHFIDLMKK